MINELQFRPSSGSAKGLTFTIWDIGGQEKLRPLWRTYIRQADAVVFVVDSSDHERLKMLIWLSTTLLKFTDYILKNSISFPLRIHESVNFSRKQEGK